MCSCIVTLRSWAQATLAKHADDERSVIYDDDKMEAGDTDDPLWNAAQKQMVS